MTRIGVALHTFRKIDRTIPEILDEVRAHGFEGVEFAHRLHDADIRDTAAALSDTGLESIAAHVTLSRLESEFESLLDRYDTIDCTHLVIPHVSGGYFVTQERISSLARRLVSLADRLQSHGFTLAVHNTRAMHRPMVDQYGLHRFIDSDIIPTGGLVYCTWGLDHILPGDGRTTTGFDRLVSETDSAPIEFEIDTQHAVSVGEDPHHLFEQVSDRLLAVHLSDGIRGKRFPPTYHSSPLGDGMVDIDRDIRGALDHEVEWLIGEVDHPPDPHQSFEAISETLRRRYGAD